MNFLVYTKCTQILTEFLRLAGLYKFHQLALGRGKVCHFSGRLIKPMPVAMGIGHGGCVLLVTASLLWMGLSVEAFCPVGCLCDDETLQVNCDDVNLEVIPITLNPQVQVTIFFYFLSPKNLCLLSL
jgi:hypothetical protein